MSDPVKRPGDSLPIRDIVLDDELSVRWIPGNSPRLLLVFTGVQHGHGDVPLNEFARTASNGARNHVLFISDRKRSWFSRRGLGLRITTIVTDFMAQHGIERLDAVGNSMGGYGAILFSQALPIRRVAAFAPQISMDPAVIGETRWDWFRDQFGPELKPSVAEAVVNSQAEIHVIYGAACPRDSRQIALLPPAPNLHLHPIRDWWHDVAQGLKEMGLMEDLFKAIFDGTPWDVAFFAARANGPVLRTRTKLRRLRNRLGLQRR